MKFIKKFFVIIIALLLICFLFIYRQYNIKKVQEIKNSIPTETKQDIVCEDSYNPVCGEDKKTYSNECVATKINEVNIAYKGECKEEIKDTGSQDLTGSGIGESNLGNYTDSGTSSTGESIPKTEEKPVQTVEEKVSPDYYKNLRSQCNTDSCCLSSVDTMENGNYKEAVDGICSNGYTQDTLKCEQSYKWCILKPASDSNSGATQNSSGTVNGEKVLNYYNSNFNYGFSLPVHTYYSGYGAQDGANHTVGISSSSGVTDFAGSDVKVYFYKSKILPELASSVSGTFVDKSNGKTYLELSGNSFVIEGSSGTEKIVNMILNTVYVK